MSQDFGRHDGWHFIEMALRSRHRTLDPRSADHFFVPSFQSQLGSHHATWQWLRGAYPHFNATVAAGVARHVWAPMADDDGIGVYEALAGLERKLVHDAAAAVKDRRTAEAWLFLNHTVMMDHYAIRWNTSQVLGNGAQGARRGLYTPGKDINVPPGTIIDAHVNTRGCAAPGITRDKILFFHGSLSTEEQWSVDAGNARRAVWLAHKDRPGFTIINTRHPADREKEARLTAELVAGSGFVNQMMFSHRFCLAPAGNAGGFGSRVQFAMKKGCVPVFIQPNTATVLEETLDFARFGIRLRMVGGASARP